MTQAYLVRATHFQWSKSTYPIAADAMIIFGHMTNQYSTKTFKNKTDRFLKFYTQQLYKFEYHLRQ